MNKEGTELLLPDAWQTIEFLVESNKMLSLSAAPIAVDSRPTAPFEQGTLILL